MSLRDLDDTIPECVEPGDKTSHTFYKADLVRLPGEFVVRSRNSMRHGFLHGDYIGEKLYVIGMQNILRKQYFDMQIAASNFGISMVLNAPNGITIYFSWFHNEIRILSGAAPRRAQIHINPGKMPSRKFTILRREILNLLKQHDVPQTAADKFIQQTTAQLRSAVKSYRRGLAVPDKAAKRWPGDRLPGENAEEFVRRVYGEQIENAGMTQADLGKIDRKALNALRNYCNHRGLPVSGVMPPGKQNPDQVVTKFGKLTYENSVVAWRDNPTPENLARKRAFAALQTRKSRARNHDPT